MRKPRLYVLCGLPAAGKSTWLAQYHFDWNRTVVASSDGHIEKYAKKVGKTYSDVFGEYIPTAIDLMHQDVNYAIEKGYDIVWDQTNTTAKARMAKINAVPDNYEKIAVYFPTPEEKEHARRLANRPGKNIPPEVIANMAKQLEIPTEKEGFDRIIFRK